MRKLFIFLMTAFFAVNVMAENFPTEFLGIPVDGSKQEMIRKLRAKGFTYHSDDDCLSGEFNGTDVYIYIRTNNNKVYRVMVAEANTFSEGQIRIRFNNLMKQFKDNSKYISSAINQDVIPKDEDISYEMAVNNKDYTGSFYQLSHPVDTTRMMVDARQFAQQLSSIYTQEEIETNAESIGEVSLLLAICKQFEKNNVWFKIMEYNGKYYIAIFYDNNYNKANGEDL